jgi:hypothetical protein
MPYILSPLIEINSPGMWLEGVAYEKKKNYSIEEDKLPPSCPRSNREITSSVLISFKLAH